jgi:bleomycin hydrolase
MVKHIHPQSFAKEVLKFNADDYVNITSFTHHPYYKSFILEAPDNFANGSFYNLPLAGDD